MPDSRLPAIKNEITIARLRDIVNTLPARLDEVIRPNKILDLDQLY